MKPHHQIGLFGYRLMTLPVRAMNGLIWLAHAAVHQMQHGMTDWTDNSPAAKALIQTTYPCEKCDHLRKIAEIEKAMPIPAIRYPPLIRPVRRDPGNADRIHK